MAYPHVLPLTSPAGETVQPDGVTVAALLSGFDGALLTSVGGAAALAVAAAGAPSQVKTGAGRLCRVLVTTTGTAAMLFYDNAAGTATGTVIGVIPANAAAGSVYDFQIPAALGIVAGGAANTPAVTVAYL